MGDSIITKFVEVIDLLQTNINEIKQINNVIHKELPSFFTTLNRLHTTLTSLSFVYKHNSAHYHLFKHHLLKFSQIDTILCKITPIGELLTQLNDIKYATTCGMKLKKYAELYISHKPSTLKSRIMKYFKIIEDVLPIVIDLNRTILGSAIRIKQPILRKAWMLAGENQLNDSSLPINIIQDNLYMLLKLEIGENTINRANKTNMYKNIINLITDDIDNRGSTKGDGNVSIAELNDLPDELMGTIDDIDYCNQNIDADHNFYVNRDTCGCFTWNNRKVDVEPVDSCESSKTDDTETVFGDTHYDAISFFDAYKQYLKSKKSKLKEKQKQKQKQKQNNAIQTDDNTIQHNDTIENAVFEGFNLLFNSNDDIIEESIKIPVDISFLENTPVLSWNTPQITSNRPKCTNDYGSDFLVKRISTISLLKPSEYDSKLNDDNSILSKVDIKLTVNDQGWGGTNHAHIRYQINDEQCIKAFTINNIENAKNKYSFTISGCEINKRLKLFNSQSTSQNIHIWMFCPPWSVWSITATSISCKLFFN